MIHLLYLYRWFKNYHYVMLKRRKRVQVESDKVPMLHQLKAHFANRLTKFEKNETLQLIYSSVEDKCVGSEDL